MSLDSALTNAALWSLCRDYGFAFLRGLPMVIAGRAKPLFFKGRKARLFNRKQVEFGSNVRLGDNVYISALGRGKVAIGSNVVLGAYTRVVISTTVNNLGSFIEIGDNVGIGEFSYLGGAGGLRIGSDTISGQYLSAHPENHVFDRPDILIRHQRTTRQGIEIGRNCWIGAKVTLLDGARVDDNSVVAAGAVVRGQFPKGVVIGGIPARVLKVISTSA